MADAKRKAVKEGVGYKMNIKILKQTENKIIFHLEKTELPLVNALRRTIMEEVPVMAIDEVTFVKNNSALYDEVLSHRMGLISFITDLNTYEIEDPDQAKTKSRVKYELKLTLEAKGPCTVYARDLVSKDPKVKPVYPDTPITILLKNQNLELEATARLGKGKEHAKFAPGLAYYKEFPILSVSKDSKLKEAAEQSKNLIVKGNKVEIKDMASWTEADEQICEKNNIKIDYDKENFIFTIESWGQLDVKKLPHLALDILEDKLKELSKLVK